MSTFSFDAGTADFQEKVLEASKRVPVLVDFWAEWCAPCRVLKPVLEKLAGEYGGRFMLAKVNSDQNQELAARCGVRGIPSVKAFVNGEMVNEFTGALPEMQVRAFIDNLLPSPAEPLRTAAQEARARGEPEVACSLLADATQVAPADEAVQLDLAEIHIDMHNVQARLKLVVAGTGADPLTLTARIDANPGDLDARLQLANALALASDYRPALEQLLEIVRRDRKWHDEVARKNMLDLFALLGTEPRNDDLVREFRIQLARILN
jgi:putative thioredoxin